MKLLTELNEDIEYIKETVEGTGEKKYYLKGIFLQADIKNKNGRIYPVNVLEKEVNRYSETLINGNRAYGELNHPTSPSINLDKVSHVITDLQRSGSNFIGTARILTEMPNGKIVKALIDEGCQLGVSSRALGAIRESRGAKIVESLMLSTAADIVAEPSAPNAFPDVVMESIVEETEWYFDGVDWKIQENKINLVDSYKRKSRQEREETFFKLFNDLFKS